MVSTYIMFYVHFYINQKNQLLSIGRSRLLLCGINAVDVRIAIL